MVKIHITVGGNVATNGKAKSSSNSNLISYLNCYAAGIFFATCILHMLPEISDKMKNEILKGNGCVISRESRLVTHRTNCG